MKMILLCLLATVTLVMAGDNLRGTTGRYCASGSYNSVTGSTNGYDSKHYCGVHMIDLRACVTITTPDNWTSMGCDNDDGFPSCTHNSNYCYWAGEKRICCCQSDYCNDCYAHNRNCDYPRNATTTTSTTTRRTTTIKATSRPLTVTPVQGCNGGVQWQGKCYYFNATMVSFLAAELACNNLGGHLASIHDAFTNTFLAGQGVLYFPSATDFWIGATLEITGSDWAWTDNTKFDFDEFSRQNNGNCAAHTLTDITWNADNCMKPKPFVCQL